MNRLLYFFVYIQILICSFSDLAFSEQMLCPNFPEKTECLKDEPHRSQGETSLCYAYVGSSLLGCALRKEGTISPYDSVDVIQYAETYKKHQLKTKPKEAVSFAKEMSKLNLMKIDPLGYGSIADSIESNILQNEICTYKTNLFTKYPILKLDREKYKKLLIYIDQHGSEFSSCPSLDSLSSEKKIVDLLEGIYKIDTFLMKNPCESKVKVKNPFKLIYKEYSKSSEISFRENLDDSLKNGWPLAVGLKDHYVQITASKLVNGVCAVLVDDPKDGESWLPLNEFQKKIEGFYHVSTNLSSSLSKQPSPKKPEENLSPKQPNLKAHSSTYDGKICRVFCNGVQKGAFSSVKSNEECNLKIQSVCL